MDDGGSILLIFLVQGAIFGIFTSLVANGKGHSGGGWFLVGFFFSLIGLIAAVGLQSRQKDVGIWKCPKCGSGNWAKKTQCYNCHEPKPAAAPAMRVPVSAGNFCFRCGSPLPVGASFCPKCGEKLA